MNPFIKMKSLTLCEERLFCKMWSSLWMALMVLKTTQITMTRFFLYIVNKYNLFFISPIRLFYIERGYMVPFKTFMLIFHHSHIKKIFHLYIYSRDCKWSYNSWWYNSNFKTFQSLLCFCLVKFFFSLQRYW